LLKPLLTRFLWYLKNWEGDLKSQGRKACGGSSPPLAPFIPVASLQTALAARIGDDLSALVTALLATRAARHQQSLHSERSEEFLLLLPVMIASSYHLRCSMLMSWVCDLRKRNARSKSKAIDNYRRMHDYPVPTVSDVWLHFYIAQEHLILALGIHLVHVSS
jgi:hypothetical protein